MNIAEALPLEQDRVRKLIALYDSVPMGFIAASMMRESIRNAERVSASGDVVGMMRAYEDLKGYK